MANRRVRNLKRPDGLFVAANIIARSAEFAEKEGVTTTEVEAEPTDEEKRLQAMSDLISTRFDCHAEQTRELVNLILGHDLPPPTRRGGSDRRDGYISWVVGSVVHHDDGLVLIDNVDSDGDATYYDTDMNRCSYIGCANSTVRPATRDEVEQFIATVGLAPAPAEGKELEPAE